MAQVLLTNDKYKKSLVGFLENLKISFELSSDLSNYKEDSLRRRPNVFFIQADDDSSPEILDLVSDIRSLFGAMATIIILGDNMSQGKMTIFLAEGADQFFSFPFDLALMEDFLSKRTESSYYNAFKYRNIPSRSTDINIKFDVKLKTLSSTGIIIDSPHLIKNGALLNFDLKCVSKNLPYEVQVLTTHSVHLDSSVFEVHAIFFELSDEIKNALTHELRTN